MYSITSHGIEHLTLCNLCHLWPWRIHGQLIPAIFNFSHIIGLVVDYFIIRNCRLYTNETTNMDMYNFFQKCHMNTLSTAWPETFWKPPFIYTAFNLNSWDMSSPSFHCSDLWKQFSDMQIIFSLNGRLAQVVTHSSPGFEVCHNLSLRLDCVLIYIRGKSWSLTLGSLYLCSWGVLI